MTIQSDINALCSNVGVLSIKGSERELSKSTPFGMVMYLKKLEAQIKAIMNVLDAKDEEIKLLKADIEKIKAMVKV